MTLSAEGDTAAIARQIVAGKIQNCRQVVLRGARDAVRDESRMRLTKVGEALGSDLVALEKASLLEVVRGLEGIAANRYFGCFSEFINIEPQEWTTGGRHRRPPRDRLNAVLSFLYALLRAECEAALEGVGLDPQVGFLHSLRPGRPGLALDLMEELRPLVDRLTVTMINRRQLSESDFEHLPGGAVYLSETGRRSVITAWQRRKEVEVPHRTLNSQVPLGLVPHIQARLLARHLRGDIGVYLPFLYR